MMGFVDLATACHALECCGEDRLDREGVEVFGLLLEQVRRLSDDAVVLAEELSRGIDGTDRPPHGGAYLRIRPGGGGKLGSGVL